MGGGSSNKPIVFVFGTQKGDADGRKKNLSAINTQVAYRAHERRREKNLKSRQRAQAKEDGTLDQPKLSSAGSSTKPETDLNFNSFSLQQTQQPQGIDHHSIRKTSQTSVISNNSLISDTSLPRLPAHVDNTRRPFSDRRESDLASNASSDRDTVGNDIWSDSLSSGRHSTPSSDLSSSSPLAPVHINSYLEQALDPFYKLPGAASDREKWLVHFYFREMGHIGFGTHSNSLFCPDRDWVSQYVSSKSLCFQWILILAEEQLGRMGVTSDSTNAIERKATAYGAMSSVLKSRAVNRDEGISGIMYAAIVDTTRTSMHLMALDRLINDTGGFDAFLDGPLGIAHPEHVATVYAFGRCPIPSLEVLEAIKSRCLETLRDLYKAAQWEQDEKRRIRSRRPWDALSRQVIDGNGVLIPANHDEHFRYYVKAQQDCFASTCITQLLNTSLDASSDYASQARHLAVLIQTLLVLREFGDSYLARAMYLKRLRYVAEMSSAEDPNTYRPLLSHAGLLLINSFVRQEVQTYFDRTKALAKGVIISKVVVDFLKIFALLQQDARVTVTGWLRGWLCYNEQLEDTEQAHLQESDLEHISAAITNTWLRDESNGT